MKIIIFLFLIMFLTACNKTTEPCDQGMVSIYAHYEYKGQGEYIIKDFFTMEECKNAVENAPSMLSDERNFCKVERVLACLGGEIVLTEEGK